MENRIRRYYFDSNHPAWKVEQGLKLNKNEVSDNSAQNSSALESIKISEISTSDNSELVEYTERQIIAAICIELYGFNEKVDLEHRRLSQQ